MQTAINQCLDLIIKDNVDEVVWAFRDTYSWFVQYHFPTKESYESVLNQFLNKISQTLIKEEYKRLQISEDKLLKTSFRSHEEIERIIQQFMKTMSKEEGIVFLGELIGAYALSVPEPLFRAAKTYLGLHQTANIPAIDDRLPMTDEMILFAWQYDWFYTFLGY